MEKVNISLLEKEVNKKERLFLVFNHFSVFDFKIKFPYNRMTSYKFQEIIGKNLTRMILLNNQTEILISDYEDQSLKLINVTNYKLVKKIMLKHKYLCFKNMFRNPFALCMNNFNEIFVKDTTNIFVINATTYKLTKKIANINIITSHILVDNENPYYLYVTNDLDSKLYKLNALNTQVLLTVKIDHPYDIKLSKNLLYITSTVEFNYTNRRIRKLNTIQSGANCVYILNKINFEKLFTIRLENWLEPRGLYVDNNYILTLAYKVDLNTKIHSKFRYLYVLDKYGQIIKEIYLDGIRLFKDFLFLQNKLIFCGYPSWLKIIELE